MKKRTRYRSDKRPGPARWPDAVCPCRLRPGEGAGLINPQTKVTSFLYDAADRQIQQRHGNSGITTQAYDAAGQETKLIHAKSAGALVNRFTYSYDQVGNRKQVLESSGDRSRSPLMRDAITSGSGPRQS